MTKPASAADQSAAPDAPAPGPVTLAIDIGGSNLKAGLLDRDGAMVGKRVKMPTMHPSPPDRVVPALVGLARQLGPYDRISVGFPGLIKSGLVQTAPNLGTKDWAGFDLAGALQAQLGKPVRMLNDATVQGLGVISGHGLECVITLGTGFGFALYQDGRLAPQLEMSQHVIRKDMTYDEYVGVEALHKVGRKQWERRVERVLAQLRAVVNFDMLYIGGGDAQELELKLPKDVKIVSNDAGITGGVRLWDSKLDDSFVKRGSAKTE
jgi:polyphosphate glucokinase